MKRLLIVDDEPDVLDSLVMALGTTYDIATANDGKMALGRLEAERFDAVVLDLLMPGMSGEELIAALAGRPHPPFIVSSASRNLAQTCARLGVTHYLQKPYRLVQLHAMLASVLRAEHAPNA